MKTKHKRIFGILFSLALMVGMIGFMSAPAYAKPAETVNVTLNYGSGHADLFDSDTLGGLQNMVGAEDVSMDKDASTITFLGIPAGVTEAELRSIIYGFFQELSGEDWLIDNGELFGDVGYKAIDDYESIQDVLNDIDPDNTEHNVLINNDLTYYLLWGRSFESVNLVNNAPICGKDAGSTMPTLSEGTKYYVDPEYPDDPGCYWITEEEEDVEIFKGGKEYICVAWIQMDSEGDYWKYFFNKEKLNVSVKGGKDVEFDVDTPGLLRVTFKATAEHDWDEGMVTEKPTTAKEGKKIFKCKQCDAEKTESIPKLNSVTSHSKMKVGKRSITISWNRVQGVDGYDIFFAKCNSKNNKYVCKNVNTIAGNNTFKWTKSGLKKGKTYKAYVKAYVMIDGSKTYVSTTPMMHAYTGNGNKKYTNAKSIKVNRTSIALDKGDTFKITAKVTKVKKGKKLFPKKHVKTVRYLSSDSSVATVSKSGKITAKGSGTCNIVAFAHNGVSKTIKVTVK